MKDDLDNLVSLAVVLIPDTTSAPQLVLVPSLSPVKGNLIRFDYYGKKEYGTICEVLYCKPGDPVYMAMSSLFGRKPHKAYAVFAATFSELAEVPDNGN